MNNTSDFKASDWSTVENIRGNIERVIYPSDTSCYTNEISSPVRTVDAFELSMLLCKIEKRLARIEQELLIIFNKDEPY